MSPKEGI